MLNFILSLLFILSTSILNALTYLVNTRANSKSSEHHLHKYEKRVLEFSSTYSTHVQTLLQRQLGRQDNAVSVQNIFSTLLQAFRAIKRTYRYQNKVFAQFQWGGFYNCNSDLSQIGWYGQTTRFVIVLIQQPNQEPM